MKYSDGTSELVIRRATHLDIAELVEMRRDFKFEDADVEDPIARTGYAADCESFLNNALQGRDWQIWVAERDGEIVAHAFLALINKVPSPLSGNQKIAYLTNVYTRPGNRGQGVGALLIAAAQEVARESRVELTIVWPSEASRTFYQRLGFEVADEPLVWKSDMELEP